MPETDERFIVSWGLLVTAKDFKEAEKKGKKLLVELIGKEAAKKLNDAIDELEIGEACEDDED